MLPLFALVFPALAFAPSEDVWQGQEPLRTRSVHPEVQHRLRHGAAWRSFVEGEGGGWQARFDERTGTAHRAWGPGIALLSEEEAARATPDEMGAALVAFLKRNEGLTGIDPSELSFGSAGRAGDRWFVRLDRVVLPALSSDPNPSGTDADAPSLDDPSGLADSSSSSYGPVPVWRGGIEARIHGGRLVLLGIDTYPDASGLRMDPVLSAETAIEVAIEDGPHPDADHTSPEARLVVLPLERDGALDLVPCWEVRTATTEPPGKWVSFVDAATGDLLNVHNEVRFLVEGRLWATHDERTVDGTWDTSAVPWADVRTDSARAQTGADGSYAVDGDAPVSATLAGAYVRVRNQNGDDGSLSTDGGEAIWTDTAATQAEIDSYIFVNDVRDWAETYAPEVAIVTDLTTAKVNWTDSSCNAYYDGAVNFYEEDRTCNNTGRIADVVHHEWGHGFHYYSLVTGVYDSSLSEGASDVVAFLNSGDSRVAPYFYKDGGAIRNVATDRVYPDDWVNESHTDGLIFGGAVWDLWDELEERMSEEEAYDTVNRLFVTALKAGPEIPDAYDEFVAADDDDGDLSNGTPNQCAILDAFLPHGLGPAGGASLFGLSHEPLENQAATAEEYPVAADLQSLAPECSSFDLAAAEVHSSSDVGASWADAALSASGDGVSGAIPAVPDGSIVHYWIDALSTDGSSVSVPAGATINPFTFFVGTLEEIYCEDFEESDGGYTHELLSGRDEEGADDWMWDRPRGLGGDPDYAASGQNVWGNDLGGGNFNGEYQDGKHNRLSSPPIEIGDAERVVLQYRRWLNVEDGYYDHARILGNGNAIWSNHESRQSIGDEHHQDEQWALHTVEVPLDGSGEVTLSWEIESDEGLSFGGWNIDDVCLYRVVASPVEDETDDDASTDTGSDGDDGAAGVPSAKGEDSLTGCGCASATGSRAGGVAGIALAAVAFARRRRYAIA